MKNRYVLSLLAIVIVIVVTFYLFSHKSETITAVGTQAKLQNAALAPIDSSEQQSISVRSKNDAQSNVIANETDTIENETKLAGSFVACDIPDEIDDEQESLNNIQTYFSSLQDATTQKGRRYYALFAEPDENQTRLDLLINYINDFSADPLTAKYIINYCATGDDQRCTDSLISDLTMVDKENGAMWLSSISYYAAQGNDEKTMVKIARLTQTSLFNERIGESAVTYAEALEGSMASNFSQNAMLGLASSVVLPSFAAIRNWCNDNVSNPAIAEACLTLGRNIATRSKTLLSQAIGLVLQESIAEFQASTDLHQELTKKRQALFSQQNQETLFHFNTALMLDESLTRTYLYNLDNIGELDSQQKGLEELTQAIQQDKNYLCNLLSN
ncbi:hypothetical protein [Thalassotalea ganghwensis]